MEKQIKIAIALNLVLISLVLLVMLYNYFISRYIKIPVNLNKAEETNIVVLFESKNKTYKYSSENQYTDSKFKNYPDDEYDFLDHKQSENVPTINYLVNRTINSNQIITKKEEDLNSKRKGVIILLVSLIVFIFAIITVICKEKNNTIEMIEDYKLFKKVKN